jgi:hypothetical protein
LCLSNGPVWVTGSAPGLFAYFGLGAGQELVPYFLALLTLAGAALGAVLQWPLYILYRLVAKTNRSGPHPTSQRSAPPQANDNGH